MSFRALALVSAVLLTSPALAQLPGPLEQALATEPAEIDPEAMVMRMGLGNESIRIAVSFERDEVVYRLVEPASEDMLNEAQAEMWAGFSRDDNEDPPADTEDDSDSPSASVAVGSYDAEALRSSIGDTASFVREENGQIFYAFTPQDVPGQDGAPAEMIENLRGEVVVDASLNQLVSIRFLLDGSFKPHLAARINDFQLEQRFVHEPVLGGPRMAGMTMSMSGSSLFQPFSQRLQFDFEDVRFPQTDSPGG